MLDLAVFVDVDSDVRLANRVLRDVERGRVMDAILKQYMAFVKWGRPDRAAAAAAAAHAAPEAGV